MIRPAISYVFLNRYSSGSYGGMAPDPNGRYVELSDVTEMLEEVVGHDTTLAILKEYVEQPEMTDDREETALA